MAYKPIESHEEYLKNLEHYRKIKKNAWQSMLSGSLRICCSNLGETCSPASLVRQAYSNSAAAALFSLRYLRVLCDTSESSRSSVLNAPSQNNSAKGLQPHEISKTDRF